MFSRVAVLLSASTMALGSVAIQHHQGHQRPSGHSVADVGKMFKEQCANCHVAPDLRFKVDQAWLGQIKQTA